MNHTPTKVILEKDYNEDMATLAEKYIHRYSRLLETTQCQRDEVHFMLGLTFIILCYAFRSDIYTGFQAAVSALNLLVTHIKSIL